MKTRIKRRGKPADGKVRKACVSVMGQLQFPEDVIVVYAPKGTATTSVLEHYWRKWRREGRII